MTSAMKREDFSSSLNTILGLLVAVLVILILSAVFRFIYFCFCRRGNAVPFAVKCDFKEHLEKLQEAEADYMAGISKKVRKLSKSSRKSQSKSSKKSSKKETLLSRQPNVMVDLEKGRNGVNGAQLAEMMMRLDELVAGDTIDCVGPEIKVMPGPVIVPSQLSVASVTLPPMPSQPNVAPAPTVTLEPAQKPLAFNTNLQMTTNDAPVFTAREAPSPHVATAKEFLASVVLVPTAATPLISLATTHQGAKRETAV